jgi:hypothetical protein
VFQQMHKPNYLRVIDTVARLSTHKLNVSVSFMDENKHGRAIEDV